MSAQVGVLLLVDYRPDAVGRGARRLMFGASQLRSTPGLSFFKVLGSGRDGGFWLAPSATHQGLFATFADEAAADAFLAVSPFAAGMRSDGREFASMKLRAFSCRGKWSGKVPLDVTVAAPVEGPVAALTRASIRPHKAVAFWRHSPPSEAGLRASRGCLLAAGLGEAPLLRQATFTIWESQAAMDAYARSGAHLEAIRAARRDRYFSEDMFARFVPYAATGSWQGRSLQLAPKVQSN